MRAVINIGVGNEQKGGMGPIYTVSLSVQANQSRSRSNCAKNRVIMGYNMQYV